MLVIRRRVGESVVIEPDVEIHVLELTSMIVKLGIKGPKSTIITRGELRPSAKTPEPGASAEKKDRKPSGQARAKRKQPRKAVAKESRRKRA